MYFVITFSWVTFLSGCGGGDSGPRQPASIPTEYKATLEIAVSSAGADMSSDLGLGVDTDAHGPTILVDGKPKLFAKWTDTVEVEVDIRNTHTLVPKPLVIDSAQKITRCTAATQTLASLKSGLDKIQVNYHCIASGVLAQCTQSDAANLNTAYGAPSSKMPTDFTEGLLVHVISDLDLQKTTATQQQSGVGTAVTDNCQTSLSCASILNQNPGGGELREVDVGWPVGPYPAWDFTYLHRMMQPSNFYPLWMSASLFGHGSGVYNAGRVALVINSQLTQHSVDEMPTIAANVPSWVEKNIMCIYPRNAGTQNRVDKNDSPCPCGRLIPGYDKQICQTITALPTEISSAEEFMQKYKHCGSSSSKIDKNCDFPPLPASSNGFKVMTEASKRFTQASACAAPAGTGDCNATCLTISGVTFCDNWNEIDINASTWQDFLEQGKTYGGDGATAAISALLVLCSNQPGSKAQCNPGALQAVKSEYLDIYWGKDGAYPIVQDKIPVLLLNLDSLVQTTAGGVNAADPFICPK